MVRRNDAAGSRHILDNGSRVSRNMLRQVFGVEPGIAVIAAAGFIAHNDCQSFPLIVRGPQGKNRRPKEKNNQRKNPQRPWDGVVLSPLSFAFSPELQSCHIYLLIMISYFTCGTDLHSLDHICKRSRLPASRLYLFTFLT